MAAGTPPTLPTCCPTTLPTQAGTFHREADPKNGTTHTTAELAPAGVDSIITRLVDDPAANAAKWKKLPYLMDYEDPGTPKPGAAVLANMITPEGRKLPLLITENFGRGRTAIMATGGSWRWQMSSPLGDTAHDLFWQQLLRWLVSDTPGHVAASVPAQTAARQRRRNSHRRGSRSAVQPRSRCQGRSSYPGPERRQRPGRDDTGAR